MLQLEHGIAQKCYHFRYGRSAESHGRQDYKSTLTYKSLGPGRDIYLSGKELVASTLDRYAGSHRVTLELSLPVYILQHCTSNQALLINLFTAVLIQAVGRYSRP
jgi:hypothetical protein